MCLRRINTEGREPRRHGEFLKWSFAHGNKNKGIGLVGSGLMAGGCGEFGSCALGSSYRACRGEGWGEEGKVGVC